MTGVDDDRRDAVLPVTSAGDGQEHLVAEHLMTVGSAGRYSALCGHRVWAAVLACPSGPPCADCLTIRNPRGRRHRRANQRRVWTRLAGWLVPWAAVPRRRPR